MLNEKRLLTYKIKLKPVFASSAYDVTRMFTTHCDNKILIMVKACALIKTKIARNNIIYAFKIFKFKLNLKHIQCKFQHILLKKLDR